MGTLPSGDELIASSAQYLIEGDENDAASLILSCSGGDVGESGNSYYSFGDEIQPVNVYLRGPRSAVEILRDQGHPLSQSIRSAVMAVLGPDFAVSITISASIAPIENVVWREELLALARGTKVFNQAPIAEKVIVWNGLRFQSPAEVSIAVALDKAKVLFLPLCRARLNDSSTRATREPDFLVCHDGKWGILEVDGGTYHPASRAVHDHERDRLFKSHGIREVQHFDAMRCAAKPDQVVKEFLALLEKAY